MSPFFLVEAWACRKGDSWFTLAPGQAFPPLLLVSRNCGLRSCLTTQYIKYCRNTTFDECGNSIHMPSAGLWWKRTLGMIWKATPPVTFVNTSSKHMTLLGAVGNWWLMHKLPNKGLEYILRECNSKCCLLGGKSWALSYMNLSSNLIYWLCYFGLC